ncbi:MAG: hypothetical protein SF029_22620 [bacterium]|nr:hypothetical protein [bacterium]
MSFIQIESPVDESANQQRLSHILTLILAAVLFLFGLNTRASALNATTSYADNQAGIRLDYPRDWLLETGVAGRDPFVFRVQNITRPGFKTTIEIAIQPVGRDTTERNVLDSLSMSRFNTLAAYDVFSIDESYVLPDGNRGFAMEYTYVETTLDPFLESIPVVVRGLDVLIITRGQALVMTFRSDSRTFDSDLPIFTRFLRRLDY